MSLIDALTTSGETTRRASGEGNLHRAAVHEAAHAVAAICYSLPIRELIIDATGCGITRCWGERFGRDRAEAWTITTYCGPEAELAAFGDSADGGDLSAINDMLDRLGLAWSPAKLLGLRHAARHLIVREQSNIRVVATALIERRHLNASDVNRLLGTGI